MLHRFNLFGSEAKFWRVLFQIVHVCTIGIVTRCQFTCHRSSVAGQYNTIVADNRNTLQCSLVILTRNALCMLLRVVVALIVAVVHAVVVGIHRETVSLLPCFGIVAWG